MKDYNSINCEWLHKQLEKLPLFRYPFDLNKLPDDGIYFFYERGETWGHGKNKPRIVRIGTHRSGNFKSRISEHYLLDERKMDFNSTQAAPRERSIFRKNIGRALLNKQKSNYLDIWEIDFTNKKSRKTKGHLRNIKLEKKIEGQISRILRENFSFRFIEIKNEMGSEGLESRLIGTVAQCQLCKPSVRWLGQYSPKSEIRESGLWLVQHLRNKGLTNKDKIKIANIIKNRFELIVFLSK